MTKKILLLGSGMMAQSVVTYLLLRPQNCIHIASNIISDARAIAEKKGQRCLYSAIDVKDSTALQPLVSWSDIVISYVPAFLHPFVGKVCLEVGRNLVTASYVSPQMQGMHKEAIDKGLLFLNELGLDPGIDHLATMRTVDEVREKKGKILEYESWCGGLPSPSCCDNPLGYKFTWSPIGAFRALLNKAVFIDNQQQTTVQASKLLYYATAIQLNQALTLQGYPNRDSVSYKHIYGLNDANKVLRGTLRYKGFCLIISGFKELGVFGDNKIEAKTWGQYVDQLLHTQEGSSLQEKIWNKCVRHIDKYSALDVKEQMKIVVKLMHAFKFFGIFSRQSKIFDPALSSLENLVQLLTEKLSLKPGETDLVAMQHRFVIQYGNKLIRRTSTLIQIGEKNGFSAMSVTVGYPTAIGTQLILDGKITQRGVARPISAEIYIPVIAELEKCGIRLIEADEELD